MRGSRTPWRSLPRDPSTTIKEPAARCQKGTATPRPHFSGEAHGWHAEVNIAGSLITETLTVPGPALVGACPFRIWVADPPGHTLEPSPAPSSAPCTQPGSRIPSGATATFTASVGVPPPSIAEDTLHGQLPLVGQAADPNGNASVILLVYTTP